MAAREPSEVSAPPDLTQAVKPKAFHASRKTLVLVADPVPAAQGGQLLKAAAVFDPPAPL